MTPSPDRLEANLLRRERMVLRDRLQQAQAALAAFTARHEWRGAALARTTIVNLTVDLEVNRRRRCGAHLPTDGPERATVRR